MNDKSRRIHAEKIGKTTWVHIDGRTFKIKASGSSRSKGVKSDGNVLFDGTLKSPMPGKILKILVAPGDKVVTRQSLIIVEAMKMEHSLSSPIKGTIGSVFKKSGDQVSLDEELIEIKKEE